MRERRRQAWPGHPGGVRPAPAAPALHRKATGTPGAGIARGSIAAGARPETERLAGTWRSGLDRGEMTAAI